ncbi:hypothetical protein, partial [Nostoc linckia]|uniref:hypothetical protein n=2 Tax=Nostoc linckia TaxID=92942 RepID=UPI001C55850F
CIKSGAWGMGDGAWRDEGDKGDKGDEGDKGDKGDEGDKGDKGDKNNSPVISQQSSVISPHS